MAKQIEGVYEEVLESAKIEFLNKGFKDASLRAIASKAKTSTGSIYTRFESKEGLFRAIVEPVINGLEQMFINYQEYFHQQEPQYQQENMYEYTKKTSTDFIHYIYEHFEIFQIILTGASGTEFENFINDLVDIELDYTVKYMNMIENHSIESGQISREFLHMVNSAYYTGIFEIVLHHVEKEDGLKYVEMLREFYYAGFKQIYQLK